MDGYEKAQDHYDNLLKGVHYLLVAHAAGLLTCLSAIKDTANVLALGGIGNLVTLFGVGLISATVLWVLCLVGRMELLAALQLKVAKPDPTWSFITYWGTTICVWVSVPAFIAAIVLVIIKFGFL